MVPYLDDIFIVGETSEKCEAAQLCLISGNPPRFVGKLERDRDANERFQFLGLIIDSRLQAVKFRKIRSHPFSNIVKNFMAKKRSRKRNFRACLVT